VSEWLDLMLDEIARKRREIKEAEEENLRRSKEQDQKQDEQTDQSK
jgi:hypothetical protein